jgi:hypothetical protein
MKAALFFILLFAASSSTASPMLDMPRKGLSVAYVDGDRIEVLCNKSGERCSVAVHVAGKSATFKPSSLGGAEVLPWRAMLYVNPGQNRAQYYSFEVSVVCPDDLPDKPMGSCNAHVTVQQGSEPEVELVRVP